MGRGKNLFFKIDQNGQLPLRLLLKDIGTNKSTSIAIESLYYCVPIKYANSGSFHIPINRLYPQDMLSDEEEIRHSLKHISKEYQLQIPHIIICKKKNKILSIPIKYLCFQLIKERSTELIPIEPLIINVPTLEEDVVEYLFNPVYLYLEELNNDIHKMFYENHKELSIELLKQFNQQHSLNNLHPEIYLKCKDLYKDGYYSEAVEKGFKVVKDRLRKLTGYEKGSDAFGKGNLHIKGASAPNVDQDFNDATKFLTMAIDKYRNEKSHTSNAKIDNPTRAYEYLRLSSLAMNLLEDAEIRR